ncbi:MAG: zinc-ribbon domain-containing protein [Candidatus Acidiferrales bacterium]
MQCPKCQTEASDTARFCPRCHNTLRFECPACHHQQLHGGTCDKCGINFLKYLSAVVEVKKAESDGARTKNLKRSNLIKNLLLLPFDMGWSFFRDLRAGLKKPSRY